MATVKHCGMYNAQYRQLVANGSAESPVQLDIKCNEMRTLPLHLTPEQRCNYSEVSQLMPFTGLLWLLFTYISRREVGHQYRLNYPANVIHSKLVNSFALIWWNVFSFSLINEIVSVTQQHSVINPGLPGLQSFPPGWCWSSVPCCASSQHLIETPLMDGWW